MSSTRRAEAGAPLRQERFASAPELERGLMGNLVAKRCSVLDDAKERELIWFLQLLSHQPGGPEKVAADLLAKFPERLGTPSMMKFGTKPAAIYNAQQVRTVRDELPVEPWEMLEREWESDIHFGIHKREHLQFRKKWECQFPLRGEGLYAKADTTRETIRTAQAQSERLPDKYPASVFVEVAREAATELGGLLERFCLDPALTFAKCAPWYFPQIAETLREYQAAWIEDRRRRVVVTELGRLVYDALDYALEARCLVLIDGQARMGKTFSVKAWCDLHPGRARYVQVPSTNDDFGFYRAIAASLGVSINLKAKAQQLRDRVEEVLHAGDLLLCFDEAHYLWRQVNYRWALPSRVNWIMTACVNHGVPVALVTTPQFLRAQELVRGSTCWNSDQLTGRIRHYAKLPDHLSEKDLASVARNLLPEGDSKSIAFLVKYAQASLKYLAAIESVVCRARYIVAKAGRNEVTREDIKRAMQESIIPSDSTLAMALAEPPKTGLRGSRKTRAMPLQPRGNPFAISTRPTATAPTTFAAPIGSATTEGIASSLERTAVHELVPG